MMTTDEARAGTPNAVDAQMAWQKMMQTRRREEQGRDTTIDAGRT